MKINLLFIVLFIPGFFSTGCHGKQQSKSATEENKSTSSGSAAPLPFLSSMDVNSLYGMVDNVDIIFYKLPISVSQDDPGSAKNTARYVVPASPNVSAKCDPVGRLTWISKSKIIREADFYIGEGCNHLVFIENGQPAYSNAMSPEGVQFFQTVMSQVKPPDK